jgi:hypothetical protein
MLLFGQNSHDLEAKKTRKYLKIAQTYNNTLLPCCFYDVTQSRMRREAPNYATTLRNIAQYKGTSTAINGRKYPRNF